MKQALKKNGAAADLQSGLTVRQAAKLLNVSERLVYMTKRVMRSGRQDLVDAIERGDISVHAALREIDGPKPKAPRADRDLDRLAEIYSLLHEACDLFVHGVLHEADPMRAMELVNQARVASYCLYIGLGGTDRRVREIGAKVARQIRVRRRIK